MSLDDDINDLYRLPLGEFTAARNALAKTLTGDDAKRVKALAKPTIVPWAVNQLYWQARPLFDKLMKHGDELRGAQIAALKGRPGDLPRASEQHRKTVAESVRKATELAGAQDAHPGADDVARMLEALSLAPARPEHPGRLTELVQPAGFEALAGVTPIPMGSARSTGLSAGPHVQEKHQPKHNVSAFRRTADEAARERAERAAAEKAEKEAERRRQEAQANLKAAERALERAKAEEAKLRDAFDRAQEERRAAETALSAARKAARDA